MATTSVYDLGHIDRVPVFPWTENQTMDQDLTQIHTGEVTFAEAMRGQDTELIHAAKPALDEDEEEDEDEDLEDEDEDLEDDEDDLDDEDDDDDLEDDEEDEDEDEEDLEDDDDPKPLKVKSRA